jgi:energy-coupling factor transport system ATP-binding protein
MIRFVNLRYRSLAIDAFSVAPGVTSVIGRNGSGKTTLLKLCAGITEPESGTILIDGIPPRKNEVGWVNEFPDRNILFATVHEEIASSLRFRRIPCDEIEKRVISCMNLMEISHLGKRSMLELSGGEKVLVALAAALVHRPLLLVLDEYDSHLDADLTEKIEGILRQSQVTYIIRCTQDMETAARGDNIIWMINGKIGFAGNPESVFSSLVDTPFYPLAWRCRT